MASSVLFVLALALALALLTATNASPYAATTAGSSGPSPHSATATASSCPSAHDATTTASSHPSLYAATTDGFSSLSSHGATATASSFGPSPHDDATEFSGSSPRGAAATASSGPSPHGTPPAEEDLLRLLDHLMRDAAAAKSNAARMQHLGNVLQLLGFREMAAAAPSASPVLAAVASWSGPLTVFAVTDQALQESCAECWREAVLAAHVGLGSFSFSQLSAKPETKIPAGLPGYCFTAAVSSPDDVVTLLIDGVKVIRPDMYNDGRLVVHGVEGYITIPSQGSCVSSSQDVLSRTDLLRLMVALLGVQ